MLLAESVIEIFGYPLRIDCKSLNYMLTHIYDGSLLVNFERDGSHLREEEIGLVGCSILHNDHITFLILFQRTSPQMMLGLWLCVYGDIIVGLTTEFKVYLAAYRHIGDNGNFACKNLKTVALSHNSEIIVNIINCYGWQEMLTLKSIPSHFSDKHLLP